MLHLSDCLFFGGGDKLHGSRVEGLGSVGLIWVHFWDVIGPIGSVDRRFQATT